MNVSKIELDAENLYEVLHEKLSNNARLELVLRSTGSGQVRMVSVELLGEVRVKVKFRNEPIKLCTIIDFPEIYADLIKEAGRKYSHMEGGEAVFKYLTIDEMPRSSRGLLPYFIKVTQLA